MGSSNSTVTERASVIKAKTLAVGALSSGAKPQPSPRPAKRTSRDEALEFVKQQRERRAREDRLLSRSYDSAARFERRDSQFGAFEMRIAQNSSLGIWSEVRIY